MTDSIALNDYCAQDDNGSMTYGQAPGFMKYTIAHNKKQPRLLHDKTPALKGAQVEIHKMKKCIW